MALMSNNEKIFEGFILWVKRYQTEIFSHDGNKKELKGQKIDQEVVIMSMMNKWYDSQKKIPLYRALAIDDETASRLAVKGMQPQASFSAPNNEALSQPVALPNYDQLLRDHPLGDDLKRKTKSTQYIADQKGYPYPRRKYLRPVGVTDEEEARHGTIYQGVTTSSSMFSEKVKLGTTADFTQSVTYHPEVAKTVASNPDFTDS